MNIQQLLYLTANSGANFPAASFSLLAPNINDGSPGDLSTGYSLPNAPGVVAGLIDLGPSGLSGVNKFYFGGQAGCSGSMILYSSNDGTAWAQQSSSSLGNSPNSYQVTFPAVTARYWQAVVSGATGSTISLTDFRLYDTTGAIITTPLPAPPAPAAPTFGGATTGGASLPVNTQALTANATSEVVQVATDAAFNSPIANSPFAVPSPGTAVSATGLTSGTTYYVRLGMVNGGGTTYGPAASVVFDTARPTLGAISLGTDGVTLTAPWADATNVVQAAGFGASQGLTLTATGGAVTLSAVSTTGGVTTATLSRPIQRSEILTLSGSAGAFTDAANAPNASAAFSGVAVTNSSSLVPRSSYMARSTDLQGIYFGVEAPNAPGTAVLPVKRMLNLGLTTTPMIPNKGIKHAGSKATTDFQRGQEQSDTSYDSPADYNLLAYILNSVLGYQGPPTVLGGGAYQWTWLVSPTAPLLAPATFTVDQGSLRGMERFTYGVFSGTTFKWAIDTAELSGNMFGQQVIRNASPLSALATAPGSIVDISPAAIDPITVGAYLSLDGGTTFNRMQKDIDGELRMSGMWGPNYHVSDLNPSFDDIKELIPDMGLTLTVEEGTEADTFMSRLYAGQPLHAGVKSVGPVIGVVGGVNINYLLKANLPVFASKPAPGDKNGVYGNTFTFDVAHDSAFGMVQVTLINKLAGL